MNLRDNLASTLSLLRANKLRSFLTMLGIIIGVMAVIVIMSVGAGAQSLILNQIRGQGSNLVGVLPGKSEEEGPPAAAFGIVITTLKEADADAVMAAGNPHITDVAVYVRGAETVAVGDTKVDTTFVGTSASYPEVEAITLEHGRFFTSEEEKGLARIVVLGSFVAKELFGDENPVGRQIKLKKSNFMVIGVVTERGTSGFQNQDNQVFVPVSTAQKLLLGIDYVTFMGYKIDEAAYVEDGMETIRQVLREQHDITNPENDDFSVRSSNQALDVLTTITNSLKFFLASIAAISLIVGGIGIMNIMLAAVEERTREIGLRKAIGATNKDIIRQFLVETSMITFLGGIVGIILGTLIAVIVAQVAQGMGYSWDLVVTPSSIIMGCAVSIAIGLIFGLSPARKASRLNPIEALRYE